MSFLGLLTKQEVEELFIDHLKNIVIELDSDSQYILILTGAGDKEAEKADKAIREHLDLEGKNIRFLIISNPSVSLLQL